jgi:uncharacterized membrane protein HdeD (DUF308 family)
MNAAGLHRRRLHRWIFVAAGVYNLAWGLLSALFPQWLFRFADLPPLNHPAIFACLAMVVGLYGLVYLEIARVPERGWPFAAVGLLGKVLGPIGLAALIARGEWPPATLVLCLTNDFIWWVPFALYLVDAWPLYRADLKRPLPTPPLPGRGSGEAGEGAGG